MKLVIRTVFFHFVCILLFAIIYYNLKEHFIDTTNAQGPLVRDSFAKRKPRKWLDFLLMSTTIQAGVGISDLLPISDMSKWALISQQIIMICGHVLTLYVFTI